MVGGVDLLLRSVGRCHVALQRHPGQRQAGGGGTDGHATRRTVRPQARPVVGGGIWLVETARREGIDVASVERRRRTAARRPGSAPLCARRPAYAARATPPAQRPVFDTTASAVSSWRRTNSGRSRGDPQRQRLSGRRVHVDHPLAARVLHINVRIDGQVQPDGRARQGRPSSAALLRARSAPAAERENPGESAG